MPFTSQRLSIPNVVLIDVRAFADGRGFFAELYKQSDFAKLGINEVFQQDNYSRSARGTLRGLHYQLEPKAQAKLVFALRGRILDVAVDIRQGSPTFGKWVAKELSDTNHLAMFIPAGFAHGYCVLSSKADVMYKVSREYSPNHEKGIIWNDNSLNIKWPIKEPVLSDRDRSLPTLNNTPNNFVYVGVK